MSRVFVQVAQLQAVGEVVAIAGGVGREVGQGRGVAAGVENDTVVDAGLNVASSSVVWVGLVSPLATYFRTGF